MEKNKKTKNKNPAKRDVNVVNRQTGEKWYYSEIVKEHFFHPKNILLEEPREGEPAYRTGRYDAVGMVGSPACGDMMKMWIKVDKKTERVKLLKWRTFGCASAIAATSMFSVMVTEKGGRTLDEALKISPSDIMKRLGGLPDRKIHCSVLADKAFQKAVNEYFRSSEQYDRIMSDGGKIVDERLQITDHDIEEAVLEGATDLLGVQKKLKVGVGLSEESQTNIEQLIKFYRDKYYQN